MEDFKFICVLTEDRVHPKLWSPGCSQTQNVCILALRAGTQERASEPIAVALLHRCSVYKDNFPCVHLTTLISAGNCSWCVLLLSFSILKDSIFSFKSQLHPILFPFRGPHLLPRSCDTFPNILQTTSASPLLCFCQFHLYMLLESNLFNMKALLAIIRELGDSALEN